MADHGRDSGEAVFLRTLCQRTFKNQCGASDGERVLTKLYNGYADQVAHLYER